MNQSLAPFRGLFCGAGHFAKIQLRAWQSVPGAKVVALYNRSLDRARTLQGEYALETISDDYESLLDAVRPDFVDICTAAETHLPLALAAARRGLPILCQKPLAPHVVLAEELVAGCEAQSARLMVNENWRWQGWYREMKRLLVAGAVGVPQHARFVLRPGDGWGDDPYPLQPFFREMTRFVLLEVGGHYLDTMRFLLGDITALHCIIRRRNPRICGEDAALVSLEFANGVTAIFDADRAAPVAKVRPPTNGHAVIEGTEGCLRLDEEGNLFLSRRGETERPHDYVVPAGYRGGSAIAAQTHFISSLRTGTPFETAGRAYLAVERAVEACYRSATTGLTERLEVAA